MVEVEVGADSPDCHQIFGLQNHLTKICPESEEGVGGGLHPCLQMINDLFMLLHYSFSDYTHDNYHSSRCLWAGQCPVDR